MALLITKTRRRGAKVSNGSNIYKINQYMDSQQITAPSHHLNQYKMQPPQEHDCVITTAARTVAELGESPLWDPESGQLFWIDVFAGRLNAVCYRTGAEWSVEFGESIGSIARLSGGGLVAALRSGIWQLDAHGRRIRPVGLGGSLAAHHRLNDGRCDRQGRFWVGGVDETRTRRDACLYFLDREGTCHVKKSGIAISNGLAWSTDGSTMYHADTPTRQICAFDFDPATGTLSNERILYQFSSDNELPDGACVDADGNYWVALYGAGKLACISSRGRLLREVQLPCRCPTMIAFGGPELQVAFVTTSRHGHDRSEMESNPLSGSLLCLDLGVRGLVEAAWSGLTADDPNSKAPEAGQHQAT